MQLALDRLTHSPNVEQNTAFTNGNHLSLTQKYDNNQFLATKKKFSRNLRLSKFMMKKKNQTQVVTDNKIKMDRKTMMYVAPKEHPSRPSHNTHHTHHKPQNHGKVPEGYYRCSHGCLCRKGTTHQPGFHNVGSGNSRSSLGPSTGGGMQAMQGGMGGPGMYGGQGMGMQGGMGGPGMYGGQGMGMQGGMGGPGMGMRPAPVPKANIGMINDVGKMGTGLIGAMGQGMGIAQQMENQFSTLTNRNI